MILQTDSRLLPAINEFGCYFMSLCCAANKFAETQFSPERLNDLVAELDRLGYMETNDERKCWVAEPGKILRHLGLPVIYLGKFEPPTHELAANEFQIQRWKGRYISHFVLGSRGDECGWDPYGDSASVRFGALEGQRVFRRMAA